MYSEHIRPSRHAARHLGPCACMLPTHLCASRPVPLDHRPARRFLKTEIHLLSFCFSSKIQSISLLQDRNSIHLLPSLDSSFLPSLDSIPFTSLFIYPLFPFSSLSQTWNPLFPILIFLSFSFLSDNLLFPSILIPETAPWYPGNLKIFLNYEVWIEGSDVGLFFFEIERCGTI